MGVNACVTAKGIIYLAGSARWQPSLARWPRDSVPPANPTTRAIPGRASAKRSVPLRLWGPLGNVGVTAACASVGAQKAPSSLSGAFTITAGSSHPAWLGNVGKTHLSAPRRAAAWADAGGRGPPGIPWSPLPPSLGLSSR